MVSFNQYWIVEMGTRFEYEFSEVAFVSGLIRMSRTFRGSLISYFPLLVMNSLLKLRAIAQEYEHKTVIAGLRDISRS